MQAPNAELRFRLRRVSYEKMFDKNIQRRTLRSAIAKEKL